MATSLPLLAVLQSTVPSQALTPPGLGRARPELEAQLGLARMAAGEAASVEESQRFLSQGANHIVLSSFVLASVVAWRENQHVRIRG